MKDGLLLRSVYRKVMALLSELPSHLYFHNRQHTEDVFLVSLELGRISKLTDVDMQVLLLAALFHDTGYLYEYAGHEEKSKLIAANYLLQENCPSGIIDRVVETIDATRMPQHPQNEIERILCDADLFHLSQPDHLEYAALLRKEWSIQLNRKQTDEEWYQEDLLFLSKHHYLSQIGRELFTPGKENNIALLRKYE